MKWHKVIPYKIRRAISMAAIIGAPLVPTSCGGLEPDPEPTRDVDIVFNDINRNEVLTMQKLQEYANDKTIRTIYLVPTDHWDGYLAPHLPIMRKSYFQPRFDISPKIRGRGNFDFKLGEASKVPEDSLWFIKQGWTINKR